MKFDVKKYLLFIWLVVIAVAFTLLVKITLSGFPIENNIFALLSAGNRNNANEKIIKHLINGARKNLTIVISDENQDRALTLSQELKQSLWKNKYLNEDTDATFDFPAKGDKFLKDIYFDSRYLILNKELISALESNDKYKAIRNYLVRSLYSPFTSIADLKTDPFLVFPNFIRDMSQSLVGFEYSRGFIVKEKNNRYYVISSLELADKVTSHQKQREIGIFIDNYKKTIEEKSGSFLGYTGFFRFSVATQERIAREVSIIGIVSILILASILYFVFRSLKVFLIISLPILIGFVIATTATVYIFGDVYMITLGFSVSLIGCGIDYVLHYLMALQKFNLDRSKSMKYIFSGISLGCITTTIAYASLSLSSFPGLKQIAFFACIGIVSCYLTVVLLIPKLPASFTSYKKIKAPISNAFSYKMPLWLALPLIVVVIYGLTQVKLHDDFKNFEPMPEDLVKEDAEIRSHLKAFDYTKFLVANGPSLEYVLQKLEDTTLLLDKAIAQKKMDGYLSLSTFLPSNKKQEENRKLMQNIFSEKEKISEILNEFDYPTSAADLLFRDIENLDEVQFFEMEKLKNSGLKSLENILVEDNNMYAAAVFLQGNSDIQTLQKAADSVDGVVLIDNLKEINSILNNYRDESLKIISISLFLMALVLVFKYGLTIGIKTFLPPFLAVVMTLSLFGLLGINITFLHIIALQLIIGIGVDYSIYMTEGKLRGDASEVQRTVWLCAITTFVGFGFLCISTSLAVKAIGLTVASGITFCMLVLHAMKLQNIKSKNFSLCIFCGLLLNIIGCATTNDSMSRIVETNDKVLISEYLYLDISDSSIYTENLLLTQKLKGFYKDNKYQGTGIVEIIPGKLTVVMMTGMGNRFFSMVHEGSEVKTEIDSNFKINFSPMQILADMHLMYLPIDKIHGNFKMKEFIRDNILTRRVYDGSKEVIFIKYSGKDLFSDKVEFNNLERDYKLIIENVKQE